MTEQRWLKPSDVTKPGVYWIRYPLTKYMEIVHVRWSIKRLCFTDLDGSRLNYTDTARMFGPIQPPEYTGD